MARGSIYKQERKSGTVWVLRVYVGYDAETGNSKHRSKTVRGTKREAETALRRFIDELEAEAKNPAADEDDATFADLLHKWANVKEAKWSPKTTLETRRAIRNWIAPDRKTHPERWAICPGRLPLQGVTPSALDDWHTWLLTQLAPATVRRIRGMSHAALEQAVRWDLILRNPSARTEPIEGGSAEIIPPDPEDVRRLLAEIIQSDPEVALLIRLAATTGRRRGELAALRWSDLDLDRAEATFSRTLSESESDGWVERPISKNKKLQPPMAIDAVTVQMLRAHRAATAEATMSVGLPLGEKDHVFVRVLPHRTGLAPWSPDGITRRFMRVRDTVGLDDVRLHDLRHYVATNLLDQGVAAPTVGGRLGHGSGGRTTQDKYAHWLRASDQHSAAVLARLLDETG